ncbi:hypothetical protein [Altererythrobacter sp. ZODW24]|uniref:hypothetical protein n=1 Tax=Altererythrobacter sp. ZODW24 TaxID=2185142 RepID=UPI000DF74791|nr:hypothetical protein [Altererythrobacter sp. ZODW24]
MTDETYASRADSLGTIRRVLLGISGIALLGLGLVALLGASGPTEFAWLGWPLGAVLVVGMLGVALIAGKGRHFLDDEVAVTDFQRARSAGMNVFFVVAVLNAICIQFGILDLGRAYTTIVFVPAAAALLFMAFIGRD